MTEDYGFGAGFNDEEPVAIMGSTARAQTMADSSLRLIIDIQPSDLQAAFRLFGTPGTPIALARLTNEVAVKHEQPKEEKPQKGPYGEYAKDLVQAGFFRSPDVWKALGTDAEYLEWLKHMPSAISGEFSEHHDNGENYCIPAHVRRVSHGSGTGFKPKYSAIPLTNEEHQLSHQKGDSAIGDSDWWDRKRMKYVELWSQERLKAVFFCSSMTFMNPGELLKWCDTRDIARYLPASIRGYDNE